MKYLIPLLIILVGFGAMGQSDTTETLILISHKSSRSMVQTLNVKKYKGEYYNMSGKRIETEYFIIWQDLLARMSDTNGICEPSASPDSLIKWHMDRILHWMKVKQGKASNIHWHYGKDFKTPDTVCTEIHITKYGHDSRRWQDFLDTNLKK